MLLLFIWPSGLTSLRSYIRNRFNLFLYRVPLISVPLSLQNPFFNAILIQKGPCYFNCSFCYYNISFAFFASYTSTSPPDLSLPLQAFFIGQTIAAYSLLSFFVIHLLLLKLFHFQNNQLFYYLHLILQECMPYRKAELNQGYIFLFTEHLSLCHSRYCLNRYLVSLKRFYQILHLVTSVLR